MLLLLLITVCCQYFNGLMSCSSEVVCIVLQYSNFMMGQANGWDYFFICTKMQRIHVAYTHKTNSFSLNVRFGNTTE